MPRQHLKTALLAATSLADTAAVLERSVACVVTVDEDNALPRGGVGWHRYLDRLRVFDRLTQDWADLEALAATQC